MRKFLSRWSYEFNKNVRFAGFALAGSILGIASFATTYLGMYAYGLGPIMSAFVSFGVQSFMYFLAFEIGFKLADQATADGQRSAGMRFLATAVPLAIGFGGGTAIFWFALQGRIEGSQVVLSAIGLALFLVLVRRPQQAPIFFAYVMAMAISVIFSFEGIYSQWSAKDKYNNARDIGTDEFEGMIALLRKALADEADKKSSLTKPDNKDWAVMETDVAALIKEAQKTDAAAERAAGERRRSEVERAQTAQARRATAEQRKATATATLATTERELDVMQKQALELEPKVATLRQSLADAKTKLDARVKTLQDVEKGTISGKDGRGPVYRYYESGDPSELEKLGRTGNERIPPLRDLRDSVGKLQADFDPLNRQLTELRGRIERIRAQDGTARSELAITSAELGVADPSATSSTGGTTPTAQAFTGADLEGARNAYRADPTFVGLRKIEAVCASLNDRFRASGRTDTLACGRDHRAAATKVFEALTQVGEFEKQCTATQVRERAATGDPSRDAARITAATSNNPNKKSLKDIENTLVFENLMIEARKCLSVVSSLASFTDLTRDVSKRIAGLDIGLHPDTENRLAASIISFDRYDKLAIFAGLLALAMDSLLLLAGVYGTRGTLSPTAQPGPYSIIDQDRITRDVFRASSLPRASDPDDTRQMRTFLRYLSPAEPEVPTGRAQQAKPDPVRLEDILDFSEITDDTDRAEVQQIYRGIPAGQVRQGTRTVADGARRPVYFVDRRFTDNLSVMIAEYENRRKHEASTREGPTAGTSADARPTVLPIRRTGFRSS